MGAQDASTASNWCLKQMGKGWRKLFWRFLKWDSSRILLNFVDSWLNSVNEMSFLLGMTLVRSTAPILSGLHQDGYPFVLLGWSWMKRWLRIQTFPTPTGFHPAWCCCRGLASQCWPASARQQKKGRWWCLSLTTRSGEAWPRDALASVGTPRDAQGCLGMPRDAQKSLTTQCVAQWHRSMIWGVSNIFAWISWWVAFVGCSVGFQQDSSWFILRSLQAMLWQPWATMTSRNASSWPSRAGDGFCPPQQHNNCISPGIHIIQGTSGGRGKQKAFRISKSCPARYQWEVLFLHFPVQENTKEHMTHLDENW